MSGCNSPETVTTRTLIFAHRGANQEAPENTRSAFDRALEYPIDGIETDVQLSRDEVPVLWHDRFLGKLGMPWRHIDDLDYEQLMALEFNVQQSSERLMSLHDFVNAYRSRCSLLIEIKHRIGEPRTRQQIKVARTLDEIAGNDAIIVSSFDLQSLVQARDRRPDVPLIYNLTKGQNIRHMRNILIEYPFLHGLCMPVATLDRDSVDMLREHCKCIAAYTCNSEEQIGLALELEVDILISDLPQKASEAASAR